MVPTTTAALAISLTAIVPGYLTIYLWSRNKTWRGLANDLHTVLKSIALSAVIQVLLLPYVLNALYPVRDHLDAHPVRVTWWLLLTVLVLPYLLGTVAARLSDRLLSWHGAPPEPRPPPRWLVTIVERSLAFVQTIRHQPGTSALAAESATILEPTTPLWWERFLRTLRWTAQPSAEPSVWDWAVASHHIDGCYLVITWKDGSQIAGVYGRGSVAFTTPEEQGVFLQEEWLLDAHGDFKLAVANSAGILVPSLADVRSIRLLKGRNAPEEQDC